MKLLKVYFYDYAAINIGTFANHQFEFIHSELFVADSYQFYSTNLALFKDFSTYNPLSNEPNNVIIKTLKADSWAPFIEKTLRTATLPISNVVFVQNKYIAELIKEESFKLAIGEQSSTEISILFFSSSDYIYIMSI